MPLVLNRRSILVAAAILFRAPSSARAESPRSFYIATDEGAPIRNFRIAGELAPSNLPGVILAGPPRAELILYEFFDYACGYCRLAAQEVDLLLGADSEIRLGLVHHPILSPESAEAARVVLAAARLFGDEAAYRLHERMFEALGPVGAAKALAIADSLGLDAQRLAREAASAGIAAILAAHAGRASALSLPQTPSFTLGGFAFVGWPGDTSVRGFVESLRKCGGLACSERRP